METISESYGETNSGEVESPSKVMSSKRQKRLIKATGIFWDLVDLPIPLGVSPFNIHENVKSALVDKGFPVDWCSFYLYGDGQNFSDNMVECFKDAGMSFESKASQHCCYQRRIFQMYRDVHCWIAANPLSQSLVGTLVVVSSRFSRGSRRHNLGLFQSEGYNVLSVQDKNFASPFALSAKLIHTEPLEWLWSIMFREPSVKKPICSCVHKLQRTLVFWDLVDYPAPSDVDFLTATKNIELALEAMNYLGKVYFFFYFENQPLSLKEMMFYEEAEKMFFYPQGHPLKRAYKMFLDTIIWTKRYFYETPRTPINVVLVSKTIPDEPRFVHVLNKLRSSCTSFHVIHPEEEPSLSVLSTLPPVWLSRSACGENPNIVPCDNCAECTSSIAHIKTLAKQKI